MRLGFHGSRTLQDERVRIVILEEIQKHNPDYIVTHAEPEGACALVRQIAKEKGLPLILHHLNFKYLRGAFEHRSKDVLKDSNHSIFIHDGVSKGTSNEIKLSEKMKLPMTVHVLEKTIFKASVGFEIDSEWESSIAGNIQNELDTF